MTNRHKVRIKTTTPPQAEVFIDDKKINATRFKFEHDAGCLAMLTIYGFEDTEIDEDAMVVIDNTPQWTYVTDGKPKDREWYLGIFKETDTGYISPLPYICDYLGKATKATTNDGWILRGLTDTDNVLDYYRNLECVKWMPLPDSEV